MSQVVLGFVCDADYKVIAKAIRYRVTAIKRQREKRRRLEEEKLKHQKEVIEEEVDPQASETSNKKPATNTADGKVCLNSASCWQRLHLQSGSLNIEQFMFFNNT